MRRLLAKPEIPTIARAIPSAEFVRTWPTHWRPWWRRARWVPTIDTDALAAACIFLKLKQNVEIAWENAANDGAGGAYIWHDEEGHHVRIAEFDAEGGRRSCRELSRLLWHELWHAKQREVMGRRVTDSEAYEIYEQNIKREETYARLAEEFDYSERLFVLRKET